MVILCTLKMFAFSLSYVLCVDEVVLGVVKCVSAKNWHVRSMEAIFYENNIRLKIHSVMKIQTP